MMRTALLAAVTALAVAHGGPSQAADDAVILFAAGSLKAALGDVADAFARQGGHTVETAFGPSGLMRERIERGDTAHVFASANMRHPRKLAGQGKAGEVRMFARNQLCALARPGLAVTTETLLDVMLDADVRVGTSTPKADPSGDYAFELFGKAESLRAGAQAALEEKSLQLTGGPDSPKPPEGRNAYAWVMGEGRADVFLTYCTNVLLARVEDPALRIIRIPEALAVGADYGLTVLEGAPPPADELARYILSPEGQAVLQAYGFAAP